MHRHWKPLGDRAHFWWVILSRPTWRWLVTLPFAGLSIFQVIREEFFTLAAQERYRLPHYVPSWTWERWALIGAGIAVVIILESAFRHARSLQPASAQQSVDELSDALRVGSEYVQERIEERDPDGNTKYMAWQQKVDVWYRGVQELLDKTPFKKSDLNLFITLPQDRGLQVRVRGGHRQFENVLGAVEGHLINLRKIVEHYSTDK